MEIFRICVVFHLFELCVQEKTESDIFAMKNSYCSVVSEHMSQHCSRNVAVSTCDQQHNKTDIVTELATDNSVCLSPPVADVISPAHWLNQSFPAQSHCRVYSEDGTPAGSTCLRRGRPNSLKSGLPSPLQRSLLASSGMRGPVVCSKEVAVIDTSPILSTCSTTSVLRESNEDMASVLDDRNGSTTLVDSGPKASPNAQTETILDDSTHNQAFTESMLADPNFADSSLVDAANTSYRDIVDCDNDVVTCHEMLKLSQSSVTQLLSPTVSSSHDHALKPIQSSTTSLDSAIDAENMNMNESQLESEVNIPRSYSKQSIISHDSGVGLADPHHSVDFVSRTITSSQFSCEGSHCVVLGRSVHLQSVRFSSSLRASTDVRNCHSKAAVPLEAVNDKDGENADKPSSVNDSAMMSECEHVLEGHTSRLCRVNFPSSTAVSRRQSKLVPLLPISTNLIRGSSDYCSESTKRYMTNSSAAAASPSVSTVTPRIKSALLTPSFKQCLSGVDGTSQLRSRLRGKPVKRLQASPYPNHSPVNPLSPRHVTTSAHTTVAVPFDTDV